MQRRKFTQLLLACATSAAASPSGLAQGSSARTAAEAAAGVTVVDGSRAPGDWQRYGADPSGASDSTAAIQAACNANQVAFDSAGGNYLVTKAISIPAGVTVRGAGAAATVITCPDGGTSVFRAVGVSGVVVEKLKIVVTAASALAHTGAVEFFQASNCRCSACEIAGCNWAGVLLHEAVSCTVDSCYLHDFQGAVHDSADICVYRQAHHNSITNNRCMGNNWHGIMIQDPYANTLPSNNLIANNTVGAHQAYGIAVYIPTAGDTFNQVTGSTVENIEGTVLANTSGAGIYVVGAGAGGTTVANNTVRNCCLKTKVRTLAPGGIGVNGISATAAAVSISANTISDIATYDGILIVSSKGSVTVSANKASLAPGNTGGTPIRVDASSNTIVKGNTAVRDAASRGRCILVYANATSVSGVSVTDNQCYGSNYAQIEFAVAGGGHISDISCTGNVCRGARPNVGCVQVAPGANGIVSDNQCLAR
jgi:parallel beta-helix repeat protein